MSTAGFFPSQIYDELLKRTRNIYIVYQPSDNRIQYLNSALEKLLQANAESLMSNAAMLFKVVHEEDRSYVMKAYEKLIAEKEIQAVEFRIQASDNSTKWLRVDAYVLNGDNNETVACIAYDITTEREYINNLNKFNEKKNTIVEILSHDLANPLGNIQGLILLLQDRISSYIDEETKGLLEKILRNNQSCITLIREFVKREFLESSEVNIMKSRVDIVRSLNYMIEELKSTEHLTKKNIHFYRDAEKIFIEVDEVKFMQAIQNLVSNSIKFTKDDGNISVRVKEQENSILITVEDDGIGIPKAFQSTLFDKFTKARRPGLKGEPSVGLGMSIIKKIVEWHNGNIWFESEEGKGTAFHIEIPKDSIKN